MTYVATKQHYGDWAVEVPDIRITYDNFGNRAEIHTFVSAPEYGTNRVMAVGFKIKKDGTAGKQRVKPILNFGACPANVRAAFLAVGYGT